MLIRIYRELLWPPFVAIPRAATQYIEITQLYIFLQAMIVGRQKETKSIQEPDCLIHNGGKALGLAMLTTSWRWKL